MTIYSNLIVKNKKEKFNIYFYTRLFIIFIGLKIFKKFTEFEKLSIGTDLNCLTLRPGIGCSDVRASVSSLQALARLSLSTLSLDSGCIFKFLMYFF